MSSELPPGYWLRSGSGLDRALLLKFLTRTYQEFEPAGDFAHLAQTVEHYFSSKTPLWWVELASQYSPSSDLPSAIRHPLACLWLGNVVDQVRGDRHAHIFLLYVTPEHRRRGIGSALVRHAENWARKRGDRQIGLQVFQANQPALNLYGKLGFQTQSLWMVKPLQNDF
ncbi:MAG: GNAT family N-acetyltransferase [Leptolyngbyaceae bacterium]|nr:GNAT family N-acetyltransferase [Leptolyngbyaceae bacterium]